MPNTIDLYGDIPTFRLLTEGTIDQYEDDSLTELASYSFYKCSSLTSINLPLLTDIPYSTFMYCSSLTNINLPNVNSVGEYGLGYCSSLASLSLPNVTSVSRNGIIYCSSLTSLSLPKLRVIGNSTYNGGITNCPNLSNIYVPNLEGVYDRGLSNNTSLTNLNLPKCSFLATSSLSNCSSLSIVTIGTELPYMQELPTTDVFSGTPIQSGLGTIFVPQKFYSQYITALNWSTYASQITSVTTTPKLPMIFYIDNSSDEVVEFYDEHDVPITNIDVGIAPARYVITDSGTSGKPKYYAYCREMMNPGGGWGYNSTFIGATSISLGGGKTNTQLVLSTTDTSTGYRETIWQWLTRLNTNQINGFNDWFIPSKTELELLYNFLSNHPDEYNLWTAFRHIKTGSGSSQTGLGGSVWTSSEFNTTKSIYMRSAESIINNNKTGYFGCIAIRSF